MTNNNMVYVVWVEDEWNTQIYNIWANIDAAYEEAAKCNEQEAIQEEENDDYMSSKFWVESYPLLHT